ncbi:hypothetical protein ARHIZOSPH14_07970 [Agromyces rhizosphaerae]|uniref:DMT family transporter n=1 Tax=Agromyces rhizosphaerae TaxID=88374 RepID=A0A9W6CVP9_9MICO|nr:DMT family transporter [Agromyces rhizosphaerae]GLI26555.1 hypothetical protein ARHIZOSPH14_07970 [Agromyces rhizosphaerae]
MNNGAAAATAAALAAGVGVSLQTSINGHASVAVDSPVVATAVNHGSALALALLVALATGAFPRAARTIRARRAQVRWWWFLGGLMGFVAVLAIITVTPAMGVVAVGVAVTLGQLAGSVAADSFGIGPGGRRPMGALRSAGIAVAVLAVIVGSIGRFEGASALAVPVVVVAGAIIAIQQAANGWIVVVTGEPAVMSVINFAVSGFFVGSALLVALATQPIDLAALPPWAPLGGAIGAVIGVVSAVAVRIIGVLSLMLCIAAGQAMGSIALDLVVPVDRVGLTAGAVVGAVLAVAAVALAGLGAVRGRARPRASGDAGAVPQPTTNEP